MPHQTRATRWRLAAALIVGLALLLAACGSDDGDPGATGDDVADDAGGGDAGADPVTAAYGDTECPPVDGVDAPVVEFAAPFKDCIDPAKTYTAVIETTEGEVRVDLDVERTPSTTNNFVGLARSGYYDDTKLFRTERQSGIIQGGSPHTQDNTDPGPGYQLKDEAVPFTSEAYVPGALAMARTPEPDSGSAQFFLLANENGSYLGDPSQPGGGTYVVFGRTTEGIDVLQKIADLDDGAGAPTSDVRIERITITET